MKSTRSRGCQATPNQPLHLTAAALAVILVLTAPAAAAGERWR